ncbi:hypothetical protein BV25DRAFT_1816425 [Artomyces pyxidatus]|uniref:Uncharacterized protein n=1 Tax=Artomyces pyxidatus TaxID=48021 RepID=A0ACB8SG44_9AGAM|nr:hypothetical protein BV25DRAFT_1816425 [Artomyces pyxidatus]
MAQHALSKTKKKQIFSEEQEKWLQVAVACYMEKQDSGGKKELQQIYREVEDKCFQETKKKYSLFKSTVLARANG